MKMVEFSVFHNTTSTGDIDNRYVRKTSMQHLVLSHIVRVQGAAFNNHTLLHTTIGVVRVDRPLAEVIEILGFLED